jgi:hypothetical protein
MPALPQSIGHQQINQLMAVALSRWRRVYASLSTTLRLDLAQQIPAEAFHRRFELTTLRQL